jgi:hypothetical protein
MGDWFQHVVDLDALSDEARPLQRQLQAWLIQHRIIESTSAPQVFGTKGMAYQPGPRSALVIDALQGESEHIDSGQQKWVEFRTVRTVFDAGQGGVTIFCPGCQGKDLDDGTWSEAITEWFEGGLGIHECGHCQTAYPITAWIFEPAWGFSSLGCTFWNWPPLKPSFLEDIARVLGHRIQYIAGKL